MRMLGQGRLKCLKGERLPGWGDCEGEVLYFDRMARLRGSGGF